MSAVRMCDGCGMIFPEGAEGSAVGSVTAMVKGADGQVRPQQRAQDLCPVCTGGGSPTPRLAISDHPNDVQSRYDRIARDRLATRERSTEKADGRNQTRHEDGGTYDTRF